MDGARFTVLQVRRIPDSGRDPAHYVHPDGVIAAEIKVCAVKQTDVAGSKWSIFSERGKEFYKPDNHAYADLRKSGSDYAGDMRPHFPSGPMEAGACKTGWLPFDVPDGERAHPCSATE